LNPDLLSGNVNDKLSHMCRAHDHTLRLFTDDVLFQVYMSNPRNGYAGWEVTRTGRLGDMHPTTLATRTLMGILERKMF
jgi:hypothetical protein